VGASQILNSRVEAGMFDTGSNIFSGGESGNYWHRKNNDRKKLISLLWGLALIACFLAAGWIGAAP